jgi:hypothetical protein
MARLDRAIHLLPVRPAKKPVIAWMARFCVP